MEMIIEKMLGKLEAGRISRRQFATQLAALVTLVAGTGRALSKSEQEENSSTLQARELNHIALRVTDVERSQKFYEQHLGLRSTTETGYSRFMTCGPHFVALFQGSTPGLDHFSFTLENYRQEEVAEKLREKGIDPELVANRTYFRDPDGIKLQVSPAND